MNIFTKAKYKEMLDNLPESYIISKDKKLKIRTRYIKCYWINSIPYVIYSDFENKEQFHVFLYRNFRKITKIESANTLTNETFYLKNGVLHNENGFSYQKNENKEYYLKGKNYSYQEYKIIFREKKLKRILNETY